MLFILAVAVALTQHPYAHPRDAVHATAEREISGPQPPVKHVTTESRWTGPNPGDKAVIDVMAMPLGAGLTPDAVDPR